MKEDSKLNTNIDPELLLKLKEAANQNRQTLNEFVKSNLIDSSTSKKIELLEARLKAIEKHLNLETSSYDDNKTKESIFSDQGAKKYGQTAKQLFDLHLKKKKISLEQGLKELSLALHDLPHSFPKLVCQILRGSHDLTGEEMTKAYRTGSCAMRTVLVQWCQDPLEELNQAFLDAVITKKLI